MVALARGDSVHSLYLLQVHAFLRRREHTRYNAINRRHAFVGRVWNSRSDRSSSRSVTTQTLTAMHEVHRGAGCTRILRSSPVLRLRHFFLGARAPEEWKSSLCGMCSWYGRAVGRFRRFGERRNRGMVIYSPSHTRYRGICNH